MQDLNKVEAQVNTLKSWKAQMPSASDINDRKVADNDPIQAKFGSLQEIINGHITSLSIMNKKFEAIEDKSKSHA